MLIIVIVVILASLYNFYNGANDCANAIATTVSTRVLTPFKAIFLASFFNLIGAFFTTKVAETIGKGIVPENYMTSQLIISAIIGAVVWAALATHLGIPISITHCIIGGILGAGLISFGLKTINWFSFNKVLLAMVLSPVFGFLAGLLLFILILWIFKNKRSSLINRVFGKLQLLSASFMAYTHGTNDAQNAMGVITASLLAGGFISQFKVPFWVVFISALFMALGTFYGGKKVIKTMGMKLTHIKPVHGFAAETSASFVILICTILGMPISTTHVISTSIMGVGASRRLSGVRWGIAGKIVITWILTIPVAALIAALVYKILNLFF
jgi:PiT family inorganic phosphate transporter